MTERVTKLTTKILQEILEEKSDVQILSQCLGLSRFLGMFLKGSDLYEVFGEDGLKKAKRNFCKFAEDLSYDETVDLRQALIKSVRDKIMCEDLSYLQAFRLVVALSYLEYDDKFKKLKNIADTKQVIFATYCWENAVLSKEFEEDIVLACEMLKLL